MRLSGDLSTPLGPIDDPVACALHVAAAAWFGWRVARLVRRAGAARRRAAALGVFAGSAVAVLAISASYHALPAHYAAKSLLQRLDHGAIFVLIAGTLTAYHAVGFRGRGRFWMVALIWAMTGAALAVKILRWSTLGDGVGLALYVGISAVGLSSILFLERRLPWPAYVPMAAGGLVYVGGALLDHGGIAWLVPGVLGPHEIFHVAVIVALVSHWRFFHVWALPGRAPPLAPVALLRGLPAQ